MQYSIRRQLSSVEQLSLPSFSPTLSHLLFHRGLTDTETAQKFLEPDYEHDVHDPFLLKDAEKAAARIIQAIKDNERVVVYTDYDADGIPGAALFSDFFKRAGYKNYSVYIPHRHDEGFGLNIEAVEQLAGEGVKLVVTIDCGIADISAVARANELNIDVIITDHHEPPHSAAGQEELPPAFAIVDHKQMDCSYPDKNLCGSGVAYKLIQAILKKNRFDIKDGHEKWLLDMVGLATLSDMVPLTGENRVFAYFGLAVLRKTPRLGIVRLLQKLKINQRHMTEDDISFMITPRINAASRMGVPMDAYKLLTAENDDDARLHADHLDLINNERKGVVASLVREVKKTVKDRYGDFVGSGRENSNQSSSINLSGRVGLPSVIVLGNPAWRPSLLGLAANTCAQEFNRPVFLWGYDGDNSIKGSCRSEGRTHVVELMRAVPTGVFTQFGGHRHSGGFAVGNDSIHFLEQRLNEALKKIIDANPNVAASDGAADVELNANIIDAELSLDAINWSFQKDIARLAPFGTGNPKPVFLFRDLRPTQVRYFGKGSEHIELIFKKTSGDKVSAISFFGKELEWAKRVKENMPIDLIASVEKSMFRGRPELRLRVVDVVPNV